MDGGYIFGAPGLPKTPQELAQMRAVAQALAVKSASNTPRNIGEGIGAIGKALIYRGMMDDLTKAQTAGNASAADAMGSIMSGFGGAPTAAPVAPVAPATPAPPPGPSIPPQALSPNDLSTTPGPMSGGNVAQNSAALTDAVAKLESGGQGADGPAGRYVNERFQQFPAFAKQYGTGADGVTNYAKQVLAANPNATFGDMYGGYVTGTGNPATANVASLQTTTQPGAQGAYGNLVRNSPIDPKTPLSQVMASGLGDLLGPQSAYADTPKPGDTLLQQPPQAGPAMAFNGAPGNPQPGNPLAGGMPPPAPPAGMQPFTSPQNLQTLQTKPVTLPIGNQPGPQSVAPQAAPPAVSPQAQSGPTIQALMKAAQNPWLNPGQQAIVKTLLAQKLQQQDPAHALDLQLKQAQLDKSREPNVKFVPNAGHDAFGNPIGGFVNNATGQVKFISGPPDATPGAMPPGADLHGQDFLKTLPSAIGSQVKAYSEGKMPLPAGYALKSPYFQKMLQMITQYDPTFDAVNYNARSKTRNDFTSGKSAQSINALNTVIGHLQTLSDSADSLNNGSYPLINKVENYALNATGDPRIKQFDTTKKAVVDELTRVWRGSGGSEGDIKTWSDQINASNSPAQLHTVIGQIGELLQSKINSLGETYKQGMGTTAQPIQFVTPQSQQALKILEGRASGSKDSKNGGAPASSGGLPQGWTVQVH